jgi:inosine/xanthosine triphosphate pyrophosphatase family protein/dephospho-CoA kinase
MRNLVPREIFLQGVRQPRVVFFTSSLAKYLQAKLVFEGTGLLLTHRRNSDEPYRENYDGTKEELIETAIHEILKRGGAGGALFFIEDTSIRIEALSMEEDNPGLAAKEWFQRTSFEELDAVLSQLGDRRASVHSCIGLSMPGLPRPVYFYGTTHGTVAEKPAQFIPDASYPWLAPDNFSAWFIPDGAKSTLSEMSFEASLDYDFRVRSLLGLLDRLEEYTLAMNAASPVYSARSSNQNKRTPTVGQGELFQVVAPSSTIWLIIGPTCAGKTTLGNYSQQHIDCHVVDASAIVRSIRRELGRDESAISDFAAALLDERGPDVVARRIAQSYGGFLARGESLIITGFRAIEEVEYFREEYPNVRVISVEAAPRIRYGRYLRRGTRTVLDSYDAFRKHDAQQYAFGLLPVAGELADLRVVNESSLDSYYDQITKVLGIAARDAKGIVRVTSHMKPRTSQLYRCLAVLRSAGRPLTTQEIQRHLPDVRYNNANKMLKRYPELAARQEIKGENVRYHITRSGLAFLAAIDRLQA